MKKFLLLLSVVLGMSAAQAEDATTSISSFQGFTDMEDNTVFTMSNDVVTLYQNGKYLFTRSIVSVTDDEGSVSYYSYPALIYGNAGQTYANGDVVPAGWSATKTTFKGMPGAKDPSGMKATTGQMENADVWAAPLDYSGYIQYMTVKDYYDVFAAEYMTFGPVTIGGINGQWFTISERILDEDTYKYSTYSMPGFNMFTDAVTLPTDTTKEYTITGFYCIYDSVMEFVPTAIEEYIEPSDLYGVWLFGLDGEKYRITDDLYVVAATKAAEPEEESKNYIYVTDNLWEYDYYGWLFDWEPTYMAIDCQGNTELYDKIAAMKTIKGGTLVATVGSNFTNPRLLVSAAPEASENTTELKFTQVNANDSLKAYYGHTIVGMTAFYEVINGEEYLMGYTPHYNKWQPMKLDRRYMGDVQLENDHQYYFDRVVFKLKEGWSYSDTIRSMRAPAAREEFQAKKALNEAASARKVDPRNASLRMHPQDPRYYENYIICPLDANVTPTDVTEITTSKQVSGVEYVNVAGQVSNEPLDGVNIVITHYSDGSQAASKVVK